MRGVWWQAHARQQTEDRTMSTVKCSCGETVYLDGDTCCDRCGRLYNGWGQRLCDPRYWGEETGETLADILGPSHDAADLDP